MNQTRVYDLPTRVLHWLFAGLFVAAFSIAKIVDDESAVFTYHMLIGMTLVAVTALRIFWGFVGTEHARFRSFPLRPNQLVGYFKSVLSSDGRPWVGHNPASAWATIAMLTLALGMGASGYLMSNGGGEIFEEVHEIFANAFIIVVGAHIAGLILHTFRHRDGIVWSMISGEKSVSEETRGISQTRPVFAAIFVGLISLFAFQIFGNYDPARGSTEVLGYQLQLGEHEGVEGNEGNDGNEYEEEYGDD